MPSPDTDKRRHTISHRRGNDGSGRDLPVGHSIPSRPPAAHDSTSALGPDSPRTRERQPARPQQLAHPCGVPSWVASGSPTAPPAWPCAGRWLIPLERAIHWTNEGTIRAITTPTAQWVAVLTVQAEAQRRSAHWPSGSDSSPVIKASSSVSKLVSNGWSTPSRHRIA